ncbi:hypothetical protein CDL15_Pgr011333 [Punica granatum]|uniref:sucrose synthase n=1 Tax=Punica granatum TaxID=22663 RepID=A0A218WEV5_PUNGR|nr:hypothetical protein CDL15_Pgr011333 [Punica granatum]
MPSRCERSGSFRETMEASLSAHKNELVPLLSRYVAQGRGILQPHNLFDKLADILRRDHLGDKISSNTFLKFLQSTKEAVVWPPFVLFAVRPAPGVWEYIQVNVHELSLDHLNVAEYLWFKEELVNGGIHSIPKLQSALAEAEEFLYGILPITPYSEFELELQGLGFQRGWGNTVGRILKMMHLLSEILQAPEPSTLERLLRRIPMVFNVVIVVYILDQVRALEKRMVHRIQKRGLDADLRILVVTRLIPDARGRSCNQRLEQIGGTEHSYILRVPFRNENGSCTNGSRDLMWGHFWRHLPRVAGHSRSEIGNYSGGNLAASLLSYKLGIPQRNNTHAMKKAKYPDSDIYWRKYEEKYHFVSQFTADLIAMNTVDFVITSTYQEIAGSYAGKKYSDRLLRLAGVYGFWKHVSRLDRREVCRYLEMFYILEFRDLVSPTTNPRVLVQLSFRKSY